MYLMEEIFLVSSKAENGISYKLFKTVLKTEIVSLLTR